MLNDRDEKFEGQEESEYHFSEDDANYENFEAEAEPESRKPAPAGGNFRENLFNRLNSSKRMLISIVVFLILVFIAYKMVAPTSTVPSTDIAAAPVATPQTTVAKTQPVTKMQQTQPATPAIAPVAPQTTAPAAVPAQVTQTAQAQVVQGVPANQPIAPPTQASVMQPGVPLPSSAPPPTPSYQQQAPQQPAIAQQQPTVQVVAGMPPVIPVQAPQYATNQAPPTTGPTTPPPMEANMGNISAQSEKLANQLQAEYTQKVGEFASQNQALQSQVQTLNTRMANMELRLNQLVQALTRQQEGPGMEPPPPPTMQPQAVVQRISYTVQAIIPGRAWLKADNGETVTVAEGDVIKDLGRVTKIDPYDGVVEINTGSKVVSLSYGNGG